MSFRKMHGKVFCGLHMRPKIANHWRGEFSMDMPLELFGFSQDSIQCRGFGQWCRERNTHSLIANIRKAKYLLRRMGLDGFEVDWADILKRHIAPLNESCLERCEVLVSNEKPLELKFNKTSEVFITKFHYGYWNVSSILQHWTNRGKGVCLIISIGFNPFTFHFWNCICFLHTKPA